MDLQAFQGYMRRAAVGGLRVNFDRLGLFNAYKPSTRVFLYFAPTEMRPPWPLQRASY